MQGLIKANAVKSKELEDAVSEKSKRITYLETKISEYAKTNEDIDRFASFANEKYEEFRKQSRECRNPP